MSNGFKLRKIYRAGYCLGPGAIARKGLGWSTVQFSSRAFLIEHPDRGLVLIDTGYGTPFVEVSKRGLGLLYKKLLPFHFNEKDSLKNQLLADGIEESDVSLLVVTHFHPDHIGALRDFAKTKWVYRSDSLEKLSNMSRFKAFRNGFFKELVPQVPDGSIPITETTFFDKWHGLASHDLFGDGSLYLVDLPGHALGQIGVGIDQTLFAADAAWDMESLPHKLGLLVQQDRDAYQQTFTALKSFSDFVTIIPTHTMVPNA